MVRVGDGKSCQRAKEAARCRSADVNGDGKRVDIEDLLGVLGAPSCPLCACQQTGHCVPGTQKDAHCILQLMDLQGTHAGVFGSECGKVHDLKWEQKYWEKYKGLSDKGGRQIKVSDPRVHPPCKIRAVRTCTVPCTEMPM